MTHVQFCLATCMLASAAVASEATEHHAEPAGSVLVAAADPSIAPMHIGKAVVEAKPSSAGVAETLPDLPTAAGSPFSVRSVLHYPTASEMKIEEASRFSVVSAALPDTPGVSLLEASPLAGAARHMGAQHFNTEDGSSVNAFAICYRLSKRSSVQVIPGDPAPVKIPVTSMANNMGVTVGMVLRLSKSR